VRLFSTAYENGGLSVFTSVKETEESKMGGGRQSWCFLEKNSLVGKEM
jgi:hypothetical protein